MYVLPLGGVTTVFASDHFFTPNHAPEQEKNENRDQNPKLENHKSVGIINQAFCRRYKVDCTGFSCILKLFFQSLFRN